MSEAVLKLLGALIVLAWAPAGALADGTGDFHAQSINGGKVLVVGDSHTWLAGAGRQYPRWDTDARPGRNSAEGLAVAEKLLRRRHKLVLFDLATNDYQDPAGLRANLRSLWSQIGSRRLMLVTCWAEVFSCGPVNRAINGFVRRHPRRAKVIRWSRAARENPAWMSADGGHFTAEGYAARTRAILRAVRTARWCCGRR